MSSLWRKANWTAEHACLTHGDFEGVTFNFFFIPILSLTAGFVGSLENCVHCWLVVVYVEQVNDHLQCNCLIVLRSLSLLDMMITLRLNMKNLSMINEVSTGLHVE